jgi:hypothetical protein
MGAAIYHSSNFRVYKAGKGFILHNINKDFKNGHTHVEKYDTCMVMIRLINGKRTPKSKNKHFLESLIRVSNDKRYIRRLQELIVN